MREARRAGIDLPRLTVGRRVFVRGADAIAYLERLAAACTPAATDLGGGDVIDEHGQLQHREYDPESGRWAYTAAEPEQPDGREEAPDMES
jgi:hypothetical protein